MTDDAIDEVRETIREQRAVIRDDLAAAGVDVSAWSGVDGGRSEPDSDRETVDFD